MYNTISKYEFKNKLIENEFSSKKEYYYLGFQSVEYYLTKIVYYFLKEYNTEINFCCNFNLLQKIVKRLNSKEYFKLCFKEIDEKYIYSFIGAVIIDNDAAQYVISEIYKVEDFLLKIYKKEENKYLLVSKYLSNKSYELTTSFVFNDKVECTCGIKELNRYFNNTSNSVLDAKYIVLEEVYEYLIENNLYYDLNELVNGYTIDNAIEKLEILFEKKCISSPKYIYIEHDQFEETKYEVRCSIDDVNFYAVKIHNTKLMAKQLAAYAMIEMLILQNNT
ncbi:MAG: double-stranded RNA binding motif domain-containing protein [bacterium]